MISRRKKFSNFGKKLAAFTLAETLITLSVVAVIAAMTIPAVLKAKPDKNKMMFKKAYFTLEQTVSQLINNDRYYSDDSWDSAASGLVGFQDLSEADGCGSNDATNTDKRESKFACLFLKQLNVIRSQSCDDSSDQCVIEGNDGIYWYINKTDFGTAPLTILIDINGKKDPNKFEYEFDENVEPKPDRFRFYIARDGRITINSNDTVTQSYLRSTSPIQNQE